MSGGSFDYLYSSLPYDIAQAGGYAAQRMDETLSYWAMHYPEADAAFRDFHDLMMTLEECRERAKKLAPVLRAVEWHDSCDWSQEQMLDACRTYANESRPIAWSVSGYPRGDTPE